MFFNVSQLKSQSLTDTTYNHSPDTPLSMPTQKLDKPHSAIDPTHTLQTQLIFFGPLLSVQSAVECHWGAAGAGKGGGGPSPFPRDSPGRPTHHQGGGLCMYTPSAMSLYNINTQCFVISGQMLLMGTIKRLRFCACVWVSIYICTYITYVLCGGVRRRV